MDSWTALQLNGWLDGWIDWTDWRPKCQSTFAVEARRRSMSMRCECRKCWPPVHKLKALSQHTHTPTHTHTKVNNERPLSLPEMRMRNGISGFVATAKHLRRYQWQMPNDEV